MHPISRLYRLSGPLALVIALLALLVAVGGTSYAAMTLAKNSVGAKQLKNNAVTGTKVKDASLTKADFAANQLPAGPAGPAGPTGPTGAPGAPGLSGYTTVTSQLAGGGSVGGTPAATCPAGTKVIGGTGGSNSSNTYIYQTFTGNDDSVFAIQIRSLSGGSLPAGTTFYATAICAKVA